MGGVERTAAGQRHDDVEELQRADHREEDRQPDHRPEQRQRDVAEALERAGAVHLGGLEQRLVDALQAGDVQHHVEAEILPHDHDQHGDERPILAREQVDGCSPETAGDRGGEAVVAVEHVAPDEARGDVGEHIGQEEDHPERHRADDAAGDRQRHGERERQLDQQRDGDDQAVVDERAGERRVVEDVAVVLESDEVVRPAVAVPVVEAVPARLAPSAARRRP